MQVRDFRGRCVLEQKSDTQQTCLNASIVVIVCILRVECFCLLLLRGLVTNRMERLEQTFICQAASVPTYG